MIFKVKNLGYIEEAEVDLSKDLIVFTGQNNTGKTYLAYAIYFLYTNQYYEEIYDNLMQDDILISDFYIELGEKYLETRSINIDLVGNIDILLENHYQTFSDIITRQKNRISIFFAESSLQLFQDVDLQYQLNPKNLEAIKKNIFNSKYYYHSIDTYEDGFSIDQEIKKENGDNFVNFSLLKNPSRQIKIDAKKLAKILQKNIISELVEYSILNKNVYIAPASRNAINIFSKELSLTKGKVFNGKKNNIQFLNRYPKPIRDSLEIAEDLAHLSKNKSDFAYLAEELEQDFLKGTISTNQYGQIEYTPDNANKVNLEVHLTASMVKSLSNIVFYLRHLAQKGDCIIIDEPELNLHPDNQRKIARFLGRLVNEGFQVVISTHSDYIIKELNNMIMLSKAKGQRDDFIRELGFRGDELLKPEQVEAQLFTLKSRRPEKIPITDEGFEVETINEVIEKQDNDLEKIYYELFQKVL